MPRPNPLLDRQESFIVGEVSPHLYGAHTQEYYKKAARKIKNWLVSRYGTLSPRPGTLFVAEALDADPSWIRTFNFSDDQNYVLEFGSTNKLRVFDANGNPLTLLRPKLTFIEYDLSSGLPRNVMSDDLGDTWAYDEVNEPQLATRAAINADGTVVVMVHTNNTVTYSLDGGVTWATQNVTGAWNGVCYTGTQWVIVGENGATGYAASPDGVWTLATVEATVDWKQVTSDLAGNVVAVGYTTSGSNDGKAITSGDSGVTWGTLETINTDAPNFYPSTVVWDGTYWIAVGYGATYYEYAFRRTASGAWERAGSLHAPIAAAGSLRNMVALSGTLAGTVLCGVSGGVSRTTDHGYTWVYVPTGAVLGGSRDGLCALNNIVFFGTMGNLSRSADGGITWERLDGFVPWDTDSFVMVGVASYVEATDIACPYTEPDHPYLKLNQSGDVVTITCRGKPVYELVRTTGTSGVETFFFREAFAPRPETVVTGLAFTGSLNQAGDVDHPPKEWTWVVTWQIDGQRESAVSEPLVPPGPSFQACLYPDRPVTIQWDAIIGVNAYHVYRGRNGEYGYLAMVKPSGEATEHFYDDGGHPVLADPPPKWETPFATSYPAVSAYHEDRLVVANTPSNPAMIRWSATGEYDNFDDQTFKTDEDGFKRTIASRRFEEVRALVMLGELIALTSESEWLVHGNGQPISDANLQVTHLSSNGASWVDPIVMDNELLYVQSKGDEVRSLRRSADGAESEELSILIAHLLDGYEIIDWAWCRRPNNVIWIVRGDGMLLSLTYDPKLKIWAWARHALGATWANYFIRSDAFDDVDAWVATAQPTSSRQADSLVDPLGTQLGDLITFTPGGAMILAQTVTGLQPTLGREFVASVWVREFITETTVILRLVFEGGVEENFTQNVTIPAGGGWSREYVYAKVAEPGHTAIRFEIELVSGGGGALCLFGAQLEQDVQEPGEYLLTEGAPVAISEGVRCVTPVNDNGVDVPWFVVDRNGSITIERMAPTDTFLLDAAVQGFTGLDHLEGREVYGLVDDKIVGPATVVGGAVDFALEGPYQNALVGLRITREFESLDYPQGITYQKVVGRVFVETNAEEVAFDPAATLEVGEDLAHMTSVPFSEMRQGLVEQIISTELNPGARVAIRMKDPVPVEIRGITREIMTGV